MVRNLTNLINKLEIRKYFGFEVFIQQYTSIVASFYQRADAISLSFYIGYLKWRLNKSDL